jgi:hypothetical protein
MRVREDEGYDMEIHCLWGINLWRNRFENSLLLDSFEMLVYDLEVKFEKSVSDLNHLKMKVVYGNKAFEVSGEMDASKMVRSNKLIYFVVKTEEEDFSIVIERNFKTIGRVSVGAEEVLSYHLNTLRKKIVDASTNKLMASVRFNCEKAKTLSLPQNNAFWRGCAKSKQATAML